MLKRIMYDTMNSWNNEQAPAYNMKIYNLGLPRDLENRLYEIIGLDGAYDAINDLVYDFDYDMRDYGYSAGFNGRSGGYLVLYKNGTSRGFGAKEAPAAVLRAFRRLALDIRATAKYIAENAIIKGVEYTCTKKVVCLPD